LPTPPTSAPFPGTIGENTPEYVAYLLMKDIAKAENRHFVVGDADRKWILDTYAECLLAVRIPSKRLG
jgi:hypothetical protein